MLKQLGYASLDELTDAAVPDDIKLNRDLALDEPLSEYELIKRIQGIANRNQVRQILLYSITFLRLWTVYISDINEQQENVIAEILL